MSHRHLKGKGFSQTTKKFEGELKAQRQASRNAPTSHARHEEETESQQERVPAGAASRK
ncbi:hypothetical protein [Bdellovibrio sp. ArHS]|uniref:hypothetical protein n=1 Tax=Bdellovibrio sp. ArHS TaxID=1569284 RepID=UPI000AF5C797|nr:hypothetical protein [Bdellovibrio sp. ArHS]